MNSLKSYQWLLKHWLKGNVRVTIFDDWMVQYVLKLSYFRWRCSVIILGEHQGRNSSNYLQSSLRETLKYLGKGTEDDKYTEKLCFSAMNIILLSVHKVQRSTNYLIQINTLPSIVFCVNTWRYLISLCKNELIWCPNQISFLHIIFCLDARISMMSGESSVWRGNTIFKCTWAMKYKEKYHRLLKIF